MKALDIPLKEFLLSFFDPNEMVCLRVFDDRKDKPGTFSGAKLECVAGNLEGIEPELHRHNDQLRGIYFVINYGGHEDAEIRRINAQFVECDDLSIEEQLAQIEAFPLPPSLIVRTRKSLHTYWLMRDAKVADFRRVQKKLIAQFHGDKACVNESRVFRLPGFKHCKGEPYPVECIRFAPELRYTQAELEAHLPALDDEPTTTAVPKGSHKGLALVERQCSFIRHCRDNASTLSEHDWYAMITNLAVFEDGERVIHALSSPYPKYTFRETQDKIVHFLQSGTRPMTCLRIAEGGFSCPRLNDGSCACKSPAAMCYQPLDIDTMRAMLAELPVKGSLVDDMQTAQQYVRDYLYNADPVIAAAFIETELAARFGWKAPVVKLLPRMQRELHKAHADQKAAQPDASGDGMSEWYKPTTTGGMRLLPGVLANHLAGAEHAFYAASAFHVYDKGVYQMRDDLTAAARARTYMDAEYATMASINDVVGQWRMLIQRPLREINPNPYIINLRNGLYNVLDQSFKPHTPEYISTVQIHASYTTGAEYPTFLRFVNDLLRPAEATLMQEIFGYFLVPINKAQKSFLLKGAENSGKSTLLAVLQELLLGSENVSHITWQSLGDRFKTAELYNRLANIFADLPTKNIDDNSMFKALTGDDYVSAERKNKDPFSFKPHARLLFSCNVVPRNYGDRSEGFYRRLIIIPIDRAIPPEKRDPHLLEKMAAERDGILRWALEGLNRLMANNYVFSETERTRNELQQYRVESNSALSFVAECCELTEGAASLREELFTAYREYCVKNGLKAMSQTTFNRDVEAAHKGVKRGLEKVTRRKIWTGVRLAE